MVGVRRGGGRGARRPGRIASAALALVLALVGLGACDPSPPRPQFTVDGIGDRRDAVPGDGVCRVVGDSRCTLRAAIEEAEALGRGDIHVPPGGVNHHVGGNLTITGDITIDGVGPGLVAINVGTMRVAAGAKLTLQDVTGVGEVTKRFIATGSLWLNRVSFTVRDGDYAIVDVRAGGSALVTDSHLRHRAAALMETRGTLVVARSTIGDASLLSTAGAGTTQWVSNASPGTWFGSQCTWTPPVSLGYNRIASPASTCRLTAPGDGPSTVPDLSAYDPGYPTPPATSTLVDAVPIGVAGCSTQTTDLYGNPRGVDGNGDGIAGCDIGAVERQP